MYSWILDDDEKSSLQDHDRVLTKLPKAVIVHFPGEEWHIKGMEKPGLYPMRPSRQQWFLDKNRKKPVLSVHRRQLPLAPAFAMTAHAAQGQTLPAAIVDLQLGRGVSVIASYVALTRVRHRRDLLIYRPFDFDIFTQGPPEGPELLLRHLRGEDLDWSELDAKHTPTTICTGCDKTKFKDEFHFRQWHRKEKRYCRICEEEREKELLWQCARCLQWMEELRFAPSQMEKKDARWCRKCQMEGSEKKNNAMLQKAALNSKR